MKIRSLAPHRTSAGIRTRASRPRWPGRPPPCSTSAGHPALEVLGRAVKQVQYRHHRALDTALAGVNSALAQRDARRAIARDPGASAHALAVATFQSDQSFGTLAN